MKKTIVCLLASTVLGTFAGCQQTTASTPKKTGSYAAARHNMVGSNIPQPTSADNVNSTVDDNQLSKLQQNQTTNVGSSLGGGTGGAR